MPPPGLCSFLLHNLRATLKYANMSPCINCRFQSSPKDWRNQIIHWWQHLTIASPPWWDASPSKITFQPFKGCPNISPIFKSSYVVVVAIRGSQSSPSIKHIETGVSVIFYDWERVFGRGLEPHWNFEFCCKVCSFYLNIEDVVKGLNQCRHPPSPSVWIRLTTTANYRHF